jgi:hypothetical protein
MDAAAWLAVKARTYINTVAGVVAAALSVSESGWMARDNNNISLSAKADQWRSSAAAKRSASKGGISVYHGSANRSLSSATARKNNRGSGTDSINNGRQKR